MLQMYLVSAQILFSLPHLIPEFSRSTAYSYLVVLFLPLGHIGMVGFLSLLTMIQTSSLLSSQIGSMFSTLALSVERYIAVLHPFAKYGSAHCH